MPSGGDPQLVYRFHVYATASSVLKLRKPGGGILPTMVLSETHGLGAALWLCWVVRGGIRWPMRLGAFSTLSLTRPGYSPSNPSAQNPSTIAEVTPACAFGSARSSGL